jgi:hypothetical protein
LQDVGLAVQILIDRQVKQNEPATNWLPAPVYRSV